MVEKDSWNMWHFSWNIGFGQADTSRGQGKTHTEVGVGSQPFLAIKGRARRALGKAGWSPVAAGLEY